MKAPPHYLVSIDPGFPDCGAALFQDGVLVRAAWCEVTPAVGLACPWPTCGTRSAKDGFGLCTHASPPETLVELCDAIEEALDLKAHPPEVAVVEWPQIFHHKGKLQGGTVQQFLDLAAVSAVVLDRAARWNARLFRLFRYTPVEWKGSTPKDEHQRLHLCFLSPEERAVLPKTPRSKRYRSDPLDAALLGLWWLTQAGMRKGEFYAQPRDFLDLVEPVR